MFLFGARQTGKSTLLKERFNGAIYYDLLNPAVRKAFKRNPNALKEARLGLYYISCGYGLRSQGVKEFIPRRSNSLTL